MVFLTGRADEGWFDQAEDVIEYHETVLSTIDPCRLAVVRGERALLLYDVDAKPRRVREHVDRLISETTRLANGGGAGMDHEGVRVERHERLTELADALREAPER